MKILLSVICMLFGGLLFGQRSTYNHCSGAVFAPIEGSFSLSFLGAKKQNQMWLVFIAPKTGKFNLNITKISASLNDAKGVLYISNEEWCDLTPLQKTQTDSVAFDEKNFLALKNVELEKNQFATICLETQGNLRDVVLFETAFVGTLPSEDEQILSFIYNDALPVYTIVLRDGQTKAPIAGRISLQGAPEINGSYFASQLSINLKQPLKKGFIKIEAPGYFPVEYKEHRIPLGATYIDTFYLSGFKAGELTKLEQVYFSAGLPEIMEESYAQLNRLRDLLLLNPQLNIEIHGHVNLDENSAKKAQKLSKQRAEMVKNYLVQNGVAAKRLYPIGFGSSKPVYKKPKDEEEKEANRRVEILIKEN